jgi:4'-phosphopantetheinyl transferase EntD
MVDWTVAALREILPRACGVSGRSTEAPPPFLTGDEANRIRDVADARRGDFLAGRHAAREALAQIGILHAAIASGPVNEPLWPTGTIGSISHTAGFAVAAVARTEVLAALGIDVERTGAVTRDVWPEILQPRERAWVDSQPEEAQDRHATALFCLKEAFYKFQYPQAARWLEFKDVEIMAAAQPNRYRLRAGQKLSIGGQEADDFVGHIRFGDQITVAAVF